MTHLDEKEETREKNQTETTEKVGSSITSMLGSVLLVALALGFVFGFKYYLAGRTYTGPEISGPEGVISEEEDASGDVELEKDQSFKYSYIMIQGLNGREMASVKKPEEKGKKARTLEEGQILKVKERGTSDGTTYYLLEDGSYLKEDRSIMPLKDYIELEGYLTITYISASGVHLRKWADFDADNVVSSVYVGDKVNIKGKVITVTDLEAFVTDEGYYITTNSRYLNDHTNVVEKDTGSDEKSAGKKDTSTDEKTTSVDEKTREKTTSADEKTEQKDAPTETVEE